MALVNEGNTSGLGYQPPWEMSGQVANYLDETYKDNPLANIEYYTGGGYLLNPKQYLPFYEDPDHNPADYGKYGGYAPIGSEDIYVANIDYAGHQVGPMAPFVPDPSSGASKHVQRMIHEDEYNRLVEQADWQSSQIARTGLHESIHSNLFDRYEGAYPNAIAQMLKGTSELGIPASRNRYLGKRVPIGNPHIDYSSRYIPEPRDAYFEQNELLTQALTELLDPMTAPPNATLDMYDADGNLVPRLPYLGKTEYDYSKWNMDKPGGPMTKEGLNKFLFDKTQPFYEQILDDAEKGYVQDSIWATPPHLWGIRTKGT